MYHDDSLLPALGDGNAYVFVVVQLDEGEVLQTVVTDSPVQILGQQEVAASQAAVTEDQSVPRPDINKRSTETDLPLSLTSERQVCMPGSGGQASQPAAAERSFSPPTLN